ncbi:MAG: ACT domain-containing protein [Solirubrobacterales bacterium]
MNAVITVIGKDKKGIIHGVTSVLAENDINILDINQTIMQDYFTMIMLVDLSAMQIGFEDIKKKLQEKGEELSVNIRIQHEDIFKSMHEI